MQFGRVKKKVTKIIESNAINDRSQNTLLALAGRRS